MCQISLVNLHDSDLNRQLLMILQTLGSHEHDDGWGIAESSGKFYKCELPLYITLNAGSNFKKTFSKNSEPLLGHIRKASYKVPVNYQNAHPFVLNDVLMIHNGKLVPKVEKNFVTEEEVPDLDKDGKEVVEEKTGKVKTKKVSRSDSLIFLEEFIKDWAAESTENNIDSKFVKVLQTTMSKFDGKFALVFLINNTYYIARGKTADLYIEYLMDKNNKEIGWAINTSKAVLDSSTTLLSNLYQLSHDRVLNFTAPAILKSETIYKVIGNDLAVLGEIKETAEPVTYTYYKPTEWNGAGNFTGGGTTGGATKKEKPSENIDKYVQEVFTFLGGYALSLDDFQNLILAAYGVSILELEEEIIKNFCKQVLPQLRQLVTKEFRRELRRALSSRYVPIYMYKDEMQYPWIFNTRKNQEKLLARVKSEK